MTVGEARKDVDLKGHFDGSSQPEAAHDTIDDDPTLRNAIAAFVDAAKLHAKGICLDDNRMQTKGCKALRQAKAIIEERTGTLEVLIPYLDAKDDGVRFNTALALLDDHFDLVLPTLHDLDERCDTDISISAGMLLQLHGVANVGSNFQNPEFVTRELQPRHLRQKPAKSD